MCSSDLGVKDFVSFQWYGMLAPTGLPRDIVAVLNREISRALNSTDIRDRFTAQTFDPTPGSPADLLRLLESEAKRWRDVQIEVHVRLD